MLIWADGFDHYGNAAAMLDGPYTGVGGSLDTSNARNGTSCWHFNSDNGTLTRQLGKAIKTLGFSQGIQFNSFPSTGNYLIAEGLDVDGNVLWYVTNTVDGRINFGRGSGSQGTPVLQSEQCLVTGAYQFVEIKIKTDDSVGSVEVRVDGVTVLDSSDLDTNGGSTGITPSLIRWGARYTGGPYVDDCIAWDDTGDYFNDFPGDHRVRLALLDGDTAQADWAQNTGETGYGALTEIPADDDTTYVEALEPYLASEYEFEDTPDDVGQISGIFLTGKLRKTDTGDCNVQMSMVSGSSEALGSDRPMTTLYTYYGDAFVVDPDTGAPFTPAALSDARVKISRTA